MPASAARGPAFRAIIVLVPLFELLGGWSGRVGSAANNPWYQALVLPAAQPPGPVFGIAWAVLYALMGIAAGLVWATKVRGRIIALLLFAAQLALNLAWAPLFFREHQILYSLVLLGIIWLAAIITTISFGRVNRLAAWLMLPYLLWLGFAAALNYDIWRFNPHGGPTVIAEER
jgi:benzodiazapine receptor